MPEFPKSGKMSYFRKRLEVWHLLGGCRFNRLTPSQRRRQSRRTGIYDNAGAFGWALNEHLAVHRLSRKGPEQFLCAFA